MSPEFKRRLVFPIALILIGCYLIGFRLYQNRTVEITPPSAVAVQDEGKNLLAEGDKVNINTAEAKELTLLKGVGNAIAERIVEKREALGGFKTIEEIKSVKGIGEKMFEDIKDYIVIE